MSTKPVRRLVSADQAQVVNGPDVERLISDAYSIIELELVKFKTTVKSGRSLDAEQGRLLNGYIRSLTELSKEQRDRDKGTDLSNLSLEEIIALLQTNKPALKPGSDEA